MIHNFIFKGVISKKKIKNIMLYKYTIRKYYKRYIKVQHKVFNIKRFNFKYLQIKYRDFV